MSATNNIKKLLDIQDEHITFEGDCVHEEEYKGKICTFVTGKLTYDPKYCEKCNAKNIDYLVYKNGTQTSRITLPITGVKPTYLRLKKQRFFCKACERSFTAKSPIVKKHCFISKQTRAQVLIKSAETQTISSISRDCSVSTSTVQRVITEGAKPFVINLYQKICHLMNLNM